MLPTKYSINRTMKREHPSKTSFNTYETKCKLPCIKRSQYLQPLSVCSVSGVSVTSYYVALVLLISALIECYLHHYGPAITFDVNPGYNK